MDIKLSHNEKRILFLINFGIENAITCKEIAKATNLNIRTVRSCIKTIITKHRIPILGNRTGRHKGYFIPANDYELLEGTKSLQKQLIEEQKRLKILMNIDLSKLDWS